MGTGAAWTVHRLGAAYSRRNVNGLTLRVIKHTVAGQSRRLLVPPPSHAMDAQRHGRVRQSGLQLLHDRDTMPRTDAPGVQVQPAYEWLLATPGND